MSTNAVNTVGGATGTPSKLAEEYVKLLDAVGTPNYEEIQSLFAGYGCPPASTIPAIQVSFELFEAVQNRFSATKQVLERTKADLLNRNQQYTLLHQDVHRLQDDYDALLKRNTEAEERNTELHQQRAKLEVSVEQLRREVTQGRTALDVLRGKLTRREEELQVSQSRVAENLVALSQKDAVVATLRRELMKKGQHPYGAGRAADDRRSVGEGGAGGDDEAAAAAAADGSGGGPADGDGGEGAEPGYTADMLENIAADVEGRAQEARMKLNVVDLENRLSRLQEEKDSVLTQHTQYRQHVQLALQSYEAEAMLREDSMGSHVCLHSRYYAGEQQSMYERLLNVQTGDTLIAHEHKDATDGVAATSAAEAAEETAAASAGADTLLPSFAALSLELKRIVERSAKVHIDSDSRLHADLSLCASAQQHALEAGASLAGFLTTMEEEVLHRGLTLQEVREEWRKARVPVFAQAVASTLRDSAAELSKGLVGLLEQENVFVAELEAAKAKQLQLLRTSAGGGSGGAAANAAAAAAAASKNNAAAAGASTSTSSANSSITQKDSRRGQRKGSQSAAVAHVDAGVMARPPMQRQDASIQVATSELPPTAAEAAAAAAVVEASVAGHEPISSSSAAPVGVAASPPTSASTREAATVSHGADGRAPSATPTAATAQTSAFATKQEIEYGETSQRRRSTADAVVARTASPTPLDQHSGHADDRHGSAPPSSTGLTPPASAPHSSTGDRISGPVTLSGVCPNCAHAVTLSGDPAFAAHSNGAVPHELPLPLVSSAPSLAAGGGGGGQSLSISEGAVRGASQPAVALPSVYPIPPTDAAVELAPAAVGQDEATGGNASGGAPADSVHPSLPIPSVSQLSNADDARATSTRGETTLTVEKGSGKGGPSATAQSSHASGAGNFADQAAHSHSGGDSATTAPPVFTPTTTAAAAEVLEVRQQLQSTERQLTEVQAENTALRAQLQQQQEEHQRAVAAALAAAAAGAGGRGGEGRGEGSRVSSPNRERQKDEPPTIQQPSRTHEMEASPGRTGSASSALPDHHPHHHQQQQQLPDSGSHSRADAAHGVQGASTPRLQADGAAHSSDEHGALPPPERHLRPHRPSGTLPNAAESQAGDMNNNALAAAAGEEGSAPAGLSSGQDGGGRSSVAAPFTAANPHSGTGNATGAADAGKPHSASALHGVARAETAVWRGQEGEEEEEEEGGDSAAAGGSQTAVASSGQHTPTPPAQPRHGTPSPLPKQQQDSAGSSAAHSRAESRLSSDRLSLSEAPSATGRPPHSPHQSTPQQPGAFLISTRGSGIPHSANSAESSRRAVAEDTGAVHASGAPTSIAVRRPQQQPAPNSLHAVTAAAPASYLGSAIHHGGPSPTFTLDLIITGAGSNNNNPLSGGGASSSAATSTTRWAAADRSHASIASNNASTRFTGSDAAAADAGGSRGQKRTAVHKAAKRGHGTAVKTSRQPATAAPSALQSSSPPRSPLPLPPVAPPPRGEPGAAATAAAAADALPRMPGVVMPQPPPPPLSSSLSAQLQLSSPVPQRPALPAIPKRDEAVRSPSPPPTGAGAPAPAAATEGGPGPEGRGAVKSTATRHTPDAAMTPREAATAAAAAQHRSSPVPSSSFFFSPAAPSQPLADTHPASSRDASRHPDTAASPARTPSPSVPALTPRQEVQLVYQVLRLRSEAAARPHAATRSWLSRGANYPRIDVTGTSMLGLNSRAVDGAVGPWQQRAAPGRSSVYAPMFASMMPFTTALPAGCVRRPLIVRRVRSLSRRSSRRSLFRRDGDGGGGGDVGVVGTTVPRHPAPSLLPSAAALRYYLTSPAEVPRRWSTAGRHYSYTAMAGGRMHLRLLRTWQQQRRYERRAQFRGGAGDDLVTIQGSRVQQTKATMAVSMTTGAPAAAPVLAFPPFTREHLAAQAGDDHLPPFLFSPLPFSAYGAPTPAATAAALAAAGSSVGAREPLRMIASHMPIYQRAPRRKHRAAVPMRAKRDPAQQAVKRSVYTVTASAPPPLPSYHVQ